MADVSAIAVRTSLVGRESEREQLADLLMAARGGRSGVVVVRGEPGIGKTALLSQLRTGAAGFRVVHVCGVELEAELAFAALQQLCRPLMEFAEGIPALQRDALRVALGIAEGPTPDPILVSLAILTLFGVASVDQPLLCLIDDAQWLDTASLQALTFVAHRLLAEPLAMVFAARSAGSDSTFDGFAELMLDGLDTDASRALLESAIPGPFDKHVSATIISEANGNPLALLELSRSLDAAETGGGFGVAAAAKPAHVHLSFDDRIQRMPAPTRTLLLLAAADPSGNADWLWGGAELLGVGPAAATPAMADGLVTVDGSVIRFGHPLIRSAVYRNARLSDRRAAHGALADAITGSDADDYRAWHRAHAVGALNDTVAGELERSAQRARQRGGVAAAAAFLAKSAGLTSQPVTRAVRALDAAVAKLDAGQPHAARELVAFSEAATDDELLAARAELVGARIAFAADRGIDAPPLLLSAAGRLAPLDPLSSRETYLQAITSAILVGRCITDPTFSESAVALAARNAPPPPGTPRAVDLLLDGLILRIFEGHRRAAPALQNAIRAYVGEVRAGTADPRWHDITHRICLDVYDIDTYNFLAAYQLERLRSEGALSVLPLALQTNAGVEITAGNLANAARLLDQSRLITDATGAPLPGCVWAYLAAYQGREEQCRALVQHTIARAEERGEGFDIDGALYSAAVLHLGLSQYAEAFTSAAAARQHDNLGLRTHVLNEYIESAVRSQEFAAAKEAAAQLQGEAESCPTDTALGMAARATALVVAGPAAEASYRDALAHFERSPFLVYLARTHLVYGEWLRREKRRADARAQLHKALEMFVHMGAHGFADRTRRELRATGEAVLNSVPRSTALLTTQETQVATLAKDGYTNAEIAAQLFISNRTVEWHLGHIFAKLGVKSRRQLRDSNFDER